MVRIDFFVFGANPRPIVAGVLPGLVDSTCLVSASVSAPVSAVASENRIPVVTNQVARFFQRSRAMWSRPSQNSARRKEYRLFDTGVRQASTLAWVGRHHPGAHGGFQSTRQEAVLVRDFLAAATELLDPFRDRCLGDSRDPNTGSISRATYVR